MKKASKNILSLVLAALLAVSLLPTLALPVSAAWGDNGFIDLSTLPAGNVSSTDPDTPWSWNSAAQTLSLTGPGPYTLTGTLTGSIAASMSEDMEIILDGHLAPPHSTVHQGRNALTVTGSNKLTLTGNGSLAGGTGDFFGGRGIDTSGGTGELVVSGNFHISGGNGQAGVDGILAGGNTTLSGEIKLTGGNGSSSGTAGNGFYGMPGVSLFLSGNVEATGGDSSATFIQSGRAVVADNIHFMDPSACLIAKNGISIASSISLDLINDAANTRWVVDPSAITGGGTVNSPGITVNIPAYPDSLTVGLAATTLPGIGTNPANQAVTEGQAATFTVTATGIQLSYQWQVDKQDASGFQNVTDGTDGDTAQYTTPITDIGMDGYTYQVIVSNPAGSVTSNTASLSVNPSAAPVVLGGGILTDATKGVLYTHDLSSYISGGAPPYTFTLDGASSLPLGLSLSSSGVISGTPTQAGSYSFDVKVTDSKMPTNQTDTATYSITIHEAGAPEPPPTGLEPAVFAQNPMRLDLNGDRTGRFVISLGSSGIRADIISSNPTVASVIANPVTESGKNSYVQGKSVGTAEISVTFYDANGEMTGITNDRFTVEVVNTSQPPAPTPSSRSDRDSNGSSKSDTSTAVQPRPVTLAETMAAYRNALPNAADGVVTAKLSGWFSEIDLGVQQALAKQAAQDGVTVKLQISQVQSFTTVARLTLHPAEATAKVQLMASTTTPDAVNREIFLRKWFSNKLFVVATGQTGGYGQPVEVVVKPDLAEFDANNIVIYSYDKAANTYMRIEKPAYWIDKNGYLHFTTSHAGDIIVSDSALVRK